MSWSYRNYTWHTNRDTYDKIVFDDVRSNAILTAVLTYMASEDEASTPKDKIYRLVKERVSKWNGQHRVLHNVKE